MKLYKHQEKLIELNPKKWLLSWSCGTGKTLAIIKLCDNNNLKTLIICPKSVKEQWSKELEKWSEKSELYFILTKEEFKKRHKEIDIFDCVCIDEIHFFSNFKSQLTKSLLWYVYKYDIKHIYGATATPYLSSVWNIYTYGLIYGRCSKESWYKWSIRYFDRIKMGRRTIPVQKKTVDGIPIGNIIKKNINLLGNTVDINDCFDVPEQTFLEEYFYLTKDQSNAIDNLLDVEPIARWTKIHQICGGFVNNKYSEDNKFKCEKFERAVELAKEHKKIAIVCRYHNEIDNLKEKIVKFKQVFEISGRVKQIKESQEAEECVILIQAATSEGYELPDVPIMIFYSYDFSIKNFIQISGRILRANHLKKNVYISLVVKGTIDNDIHKSMKIKQDFHIELYAKKRTENNS